MRKMLIMEFAGFFPMQLWALLSDGTFGLSSSGPYPPQFCRKRGLSTTRVAQLQAAPVACIGCGSWCGLDYCEAIQTLRGKKKKTDVVSTLARMEITADFFFERGNQTAWFSLMDSLGFEQSKVKVKVKVKDTLCLPHDHRCVQHSQFYFADRFFAIPERFFGHQAHLPVRPCASLPTVNANLHF